MGLPATDKNSECILCGRCLSVCPLVRATGREELSAKAKSVIALEPALSHARLASICLGCGRCAEVCPQGIDTPSRVAGLRAAHPGFAGYALGLFLSRAETLMPLARIACELDLPGPTALAAMARPRVIPWLAINHQAAAETVRNANATSGCDPCANHEKVLLFSGCTARHLVPDRDRAARQLLEAAGREALPDDFGCCGKGFAFAGLTSLASRAAKRNVAAWRAAGRPKIAVACTSCLKGLGDYAEMDDIFAGPEEARAFARALAPLATLLAPTPFRAMSQGPARVVYHKPCSAPDSDPDRKLVASLPGAVAALEPGLACCGFGGVSQLAAPSLSDRVAATAWGAMGTRPGDLVLTGCSGCAGQLGHTAPEGIIAGHWLDTVRLD